MSGDKPRTITILRSGHTTSTTFGVTCTVTTESLEVTTVTVGDTLDPDGYVIGLCSESGVLLEEQTTAINGAMTFPGLVPWGHLRVPDV